MRQAMQRLDAIGRWSTITRQGPQTLPKSSGGVTAFKFRDPEGHPLELLSFPADKAPSKWRHADKLAFLGIDHSAISVVDTEISQRFYENFGLRVSARSLNQGPEQDNLDDLFNTCVEVTALSATNDGPHIELLCYRREAQTGASVRSSNDIAATRLILESDTPAEIADVTGKSVLDPDGHHLTILHSSALLRPQ
jgi:catechol 2,3-dioxygenase-like lactoylglutathione lyase family enzyme